VTAPISIGSTKIHRIVEQEGPFFSALEFFPTLTQELFEENRAWLTPRYFDAEDRLLLCIQSYLLETPDHVILVDSCVGNHKPRPTRPFWNMLNSDRYQMNLAAAGFRVDDIDFVMCTHLHTDHVGWNTRLENGRWVPTFPNARYVFAERELAFWEQRQRDQPETCPWITDSVLPIVAAKRADVVRSAHQFNDVVTLIPTPGHTIDHFSVRIGRPGQDAVITGDAVHSPLQARYPELGMMADYDSAQAGRTRRTLFGELSEAATTVCTAHFPSPSCGRIVRRGDAFDFVDQP
jgi:glyoxylase-like metal-dependent hydrolase (beta-lactamase superfamily II)